MLDHRLADQWFADSNAEDKAQDRTMVATLHKDVGPRLDRLKAALDSLAPEKARAELHSLRGMVSSIGLLACGHHMRELEKDWVELPAAGRLSRLTAAAESLNAGLAALFVRYPHLQEPGR